VFLRNSDTGQNHDPTQTVLQVGESARLALPLDLPPLGQAGDPLWVLPASQDPELLYLGISGDGLPAGLFLEPVQLRFRGCEGPGRLFAWQTDGVGGLAFQVDGTDGFDDRDAIPLPAGGHSHHNWGFTTNGIYRVRLQAEGRRAGIATNDLSLETVLTFHVLPLPPSEETPFQRWQRRHWPDGTPDTLQGAGADPDADGVVNAMEYALHLDPTSASRDGLPEGIQMDAGGITRPALRFTRVKAASDLDYRVTTATQLAGPWTGASGTSLIEDTGETERVSFVPDPPDGDTRFLRLEVTFK
jgi:surface-anchored protein